MPEELKISMLVAFCLADESWDLSCYNATTPVLATKRHVVTERD
jgi:hypothetical protein